MIKHQVMSLLAAAVLVSMMSGCAKDNVTGPQMNADAQAMQYLVENGDSVSAFLASEVFSIDDNGMRNPDYDALEGYGVAPEVIRTVSADFGYPLRWGRHIFWGRIIRNYDIVPSGDTIATMTVSNTIPGEFWVGWGTRSLDTVIIDTVVKKPFTEVSKRKILFRRIGRHPDLHRNWMPVAMTMVEGKSQGVRNFSISSFELMESAGHFDRTVTDPLSTWFRLGMIRGMLPIVPVRDSLKILVTISSSDDSTEIVYLRHGIGADGFGHRRGRMKLVSSTGTPGNYTRVYERTFVTRLPPFVLAARFNALVDVFSHGTVYDMVAPFSNEYWGMPYMVGRF